MRLETGLYRFLSSHQPLVALVGDRIYPVKRPEGQPLPAVTYQRVSGPREHSHGGPSKLAHPRIQISAWGSSYTQTKSVADVIRAALDGFKGIMGGADGVQVHACFGVGDVDVYHDEAKTYAVHLDFIIWHTEI